MATSKTVCLTLKKRNRNLCDISSGHASILLWSLRLCRQTIQGLSGYVAHRQEATAVFVSPASYIAQYCNVQWGGDNKWCEWMWVLDWRCCEWMWVLDCRCCVYMLYLSLHSIVDAFNLFYFIHIATSSCYTITNITGVWHSCSHRLVTNHVVKTRQSQKISKQQSHCLITDNQLCIVFDLTSVGFECHPVLSPVHRPLWQHALSLATVRLWWISSGILQVSRDACSALCLSRWTVHVYAGWSVAPEFSSLFGQCREVGVLSYLLATIIYSNGFLVF